MYLREDNLNYLDAQRTAALTKVSTKIQAQYRAHSVSSRYNALRASAFKAGPEAVISITLKGGCLWAEVLVSPVAWSGWHRFIFLL